MENIESVGALLSSSLMEEEEEEVWSPNPRIWGLFLFWVQNWNRLGEGNDFCINFPMEAHAGQGPIY